MTNPKIKALFGLKYNPFLPSIPAEDLWTPPGGGDIFVSSRNPGHGWRIRPDQRRARDGKI